MTEDILPCPFCGETQDIEIQYIDRRDREGQPVCMTCGNCGCSGPWDYCSTPTPAEDEENALASKLWNTRHESGELPAWFKEAITTRMNELLTAMEQCTNLTARHLLEREMKGVQWVLSLRRED